MPLPVTNIGPPPTCDVVVIGAGAAGLLAAARSAERGLHTVLLEKNRKPGVKILMSGGTRCNLTHHTDRAGIVGAFGPTGRFLHSALAALGPHELVQLFHDEGVATKVEETGKIFPVSDRAADVLHALLRRTCRNNVQMHISTPVKEVGIDAEMFVVRTDHGDVRARRVIVTTGGSSYPGCGTTGDGYRWMADLGHTIIAPRPALVPLLSHDDWVREMQGITLPDVQMHVRGAVQADVSRFVNRAQARGALYPLERRGSLLFTHFGISGPVALDVSRVFTALAPQDRAHLDCDLLPHVSREALDARWKEPENGRRPLANVIAEQLPRRLVDGLLRRAKIPPERRVAELNKSERRSILDQIKGATIPIHGTRGFPKAEVTAGGVSLDEVDSRTMESKLVPGLFLAGEILDLDGPIGGYNFQAAFSTGWLAGSAVS